jgi:hypothetical protein
MSPRELLYLPHDAALRELARLYGHDAIAQTEAIIIDAYLGDASVRLEFEVEAGQDGGRDDPSWDESVTLLGVLVNGCWCDVDLFDSDMRDQWEQAATDWLQEQRDTAQADRAESMARDRDEVYA